MPPEPSRPATTVRFLAFGVTAALWLSLSACAGVPAGSDGLGSWTDYTNRLDGYLAKSDTPDAAAYLAPPPTPDSLSGQADAETFRSTRALEGGDRWRQAASDAEVYTPAAALDAFADALGQRIAPEQVPALARLLGRIPSDIDRMQEGAKQQFNRPRPFLAQSGPICVARAPWLAASGSYPSGHAATGWAWALILAQIAPDRAEKILARGRDFGDSRVVCGVHYPSDVEAGRLTGAALVALLQSRPDFQSDYQTAARQFHRVEAH